MTENTIPSYLGALFDKEVEIVEVPLVQQESQAAESNLTESEDEREQERAQQQSDEEDEHQEVLQINQPKAEVERVESNSEYLARLLKESEE